jgi:hypothetical protein
MNIMRNAELTGRNKCPLTVIDAPATVRNVIRFFFTSAPLKGISEANWRNINTALDRIDEQERVGDEYVRIENDDWQLMSRILKDFLPDMYFGNTPYILDQFDALTKAGVSQAEERVA